MDAGASNPFWAYWYFHLPNYVLAALAYTMVARFGMALFVPRDWDNYIWRFFRSVTDPVIIVFAWITPSYLHGLAMPLVAAFWLTLARLVLWLTLAARHLQPPV